MNLEEAKVNIRIDSLAVQAGYKLTRAGGNELMLVCPHPDHNDTNASCSINTQSNMFQCHGCGWKGSVLDWVMGIEGCSFRDACIKLGIEGSQNEHRPSTPKNGRNVAYKPPKAKPIPEAASEPKYRPEHKYLTNTHEYKDGSGSVVYMAKRYDYPDGTKSFQLIHRTPDGTDVMNMKGVTRIPYNYEIFHQCQLIYVVEGEKCADAMMSIGMPATTTVGGSKAWISEYKEYFRDKDLVLIPDNDKAGRKFMKQIADDCCNTAKSIRILDLFTEDNYEPKWDIADEINEMSEERCEGYRNEVAEKALLAPMWVGGIQIDGSDAEQLTIKLRDRYRDWQGGGLDLKEMFPVLTNRHIRPLVGGDMLVISAATGAGKTALGQNLAMFYNERPIPWFSLELSETRMHERNIILSNEVSGDEVERMILAGEYPNIDRFRHIHVYDNALANIEYIDKQIAMMPLKTGNKPRLVVVDYIQLMPPKHPAMGTADKIGTNAVELKVLAKKHNVIMCVLSQIGRKDEANLNAAKGSGAIEESSTMLLGLNHCEGYSDARSLGVYKNSNGESGFAENLGWEGRFYKFDCTASARMSIANMEAENDETDDDDCPF
jgi:hypothetical protein